MKVVYVLLSVIAVVLIAVLVDVHDTATVSLAEMDKLRIEGDLVPINC